MITLMSYGFKYGRPEANIVLDVSYFPNPWRDEEIRNCKYGTEKGKIIEFMSKQKGIYEFCESVVSIIDKYNSLFPEENIVIALCCSAGEYRSPALVELVNELLPKDIKRNIIQSKNSKI